MDVPLDIDEIMRKAAHDAGDWNTPWFRCTQCDELVRAIRAALSEAGYAIVPATAIGNRRT